MTPAFALDLAPDGIRLLYRADGGWTVVGDASLEAPDLDGRLATLRNDAEALAQGPLATELVIPASQIRYTHVLREPGQPVTDATLRPRLDGLTPLDPEDLVFDWEVEGDVIRLAILDRTTLDEAEAFADAHGFNPVSFSARPAPDAFPRDPDFGATSMAAAFDDLPAAVASFASTRAQPQKTADAHDVDPPDRPPLTLTPAQRSESVAAADLARSLSGPKASETEEEAFTLFALRGKLPLGADDRAAATRLKIAAAVGVAAVVWFAYFSVRGDGPSDPAAVLPDTPPAVAMDAPGLALPETADLSVTTPSRVPDFAALPPAAGPGANVAPPEAPDVPADVATAPPAEMTDEDPALRYAATGIWAEGPEATASPRGQVSGNDELYIASIDPPTPSSDAIALPDPAQLVAAPPPTAPLSPPPAGTTFEFDETGLVVATRDGTWTPEGVVVTLGAPPIRPPAAPARTIDIGLPLSEIAAALPDLRPLPRPLGLIERNERASLGGLTRTELSRLQPRPRPASAQDAALAELAPDAAPSALAIAASLTPRGRPENFATQVATARAVAAALAEALPEPTQAPQAGAAPADDDGEPEITTAAVAPNIPTSASVARQATIENAIRLRDMNLIGVYGIDGNRRALIRLASGRYVKVQVGDRLDGGQIAAIGRNELRYVKGGRNITLTIPSG